METALRLLSDKNNKHKQTGEWFPPLQHARFLLKVICNMTARFERAKSNQLINWLPLPIVSLVVLLTFTVSTFLSGVYKRRYSVR